MKIKKTVIVSLSTYSPLVNSREPNLRPAQKRYQQEKLRYNKNRSFNLEKIITSLLLLHEKSNKEVYSPKHPTPSHILSTETRKTSLLVELKEAYTRRPQHLSFRQEILVLDGNKEKYKAITTRIERPPFLQISQNGWRNRLHHHN
jgi:hypothetical protein